MSKHYPHPDITKHFDGDACSDQGNRTSELQALTKKHIGHLLPVDYDTDGNYDEPGLLDYFAALQRLISQEAAKAETKAAAFLLETIRSLTPARPEDLRTSDWFALADALKKAGDMIEHELTQERLDALQGGTKG